MLAVESHILEVFAQWAQQVLIVAVGVLTFDIYLLR